MNKSAAQEERETTITMFYGKAHVWTSSLPVFNKLVKLGWTLTQDYEQSAWFEAPAKAISFRRVGKAPAGAKRPQPEQLKKAKAKRTG